MPTPRNDHRFGSKRSGSDKTHRGRPFQKSAVGTTSQQSSKKDAKPNKQKYRAFVKVMGEMSKVSLADKVRSEEEMAEMRSELSRSVRQLDALKKQRSKGKMGKKKFAELANELQYTGQSTSGEVILDSVYDFFGDSAFEGGGQMIRSMRKSSDSSALSKFSDPKPRAIKKQTKLNKDSNDETHLKSLNGLSQTDSALIADASAKVRTIGAFADGLDTSWLDKRDDLERSEQDRMDLTKAKKSALKSKRSINKQVQRKLNQEMNNERIIKHAKLIGSKKNNRKRTLIMAENTDDDTSSSKEIVSEYFLNEKTKKRAKKSHKHSDGEEGALTSSASLIMNDDDSNNDEIKDDVCHPNPLTQDGYTDHWIHLTAQNTDFNEDVKPILDQREMSATMKLFPIPFENFQPPKKLPRKPNRKSSKKRSSKIAPISVLTEDSYVMLADHDDACATLLQSSFDSDSEVDRDEDDDGRHYQKKNSPVQFSDDLHDFLECGYLSEGIFQRRCNEDNNQDDDGGGIGLSSSQKSTKLSPSSAVALSALSTYKDTWLAFKNICNESEIRKAVTIHAVNHILRRLEQQSLNTRRWKTEMVRQSVLDRIKDATKKRKSALSSSSKSNDSTSQEKVAAELLATEGVFREVEDSESEDIELSGSELDEVNWEELAGDQVINEDVKDEEDDDNKDEVSSLQESSEDEDSLDEELSEALRRDSGFRRLSMLVVLPNKESARSFVVSMMESLPKGRCIQHQRWHRFCERFGTEETSEMTKPKTGNVEFDETFKGDTNDDFWCGISFDRRGLIFCENWEKSDVILISPLRLKLTMDMDTKGKNAKHLRMKKDRLNESRKISEGDGMARVFGHHHYTSSKMDDNNNNNTNQNKSEDKKKPRLKVVNQATDLFSSIEVLMLWDICPQIEMQNIQHLMTTLSSRLNRQPSDTDFTRVDFSRLRYPLLSGIMKYFRQTVFISKYITPLSKNLFQRLSLNIGGRVKLQCVYKGVLSYIIPNVKQIFFRFDVATESQMISNDDDSNEEERKGRTKAESSDNTNIIGEARLNSFRKLILSKFRKDKNKKTLIMVADYFDFLRLRQLYKDVIQSGKIAFVSEYTDENEVRYVRKEFEKPLNEMVSSMDESEGTVLTYLVVTERWFYFNRTRMLGARRVLFYSLPQNPEFYSDLLNWLQFQSSMQRRTSLVSTEFECLCLFCKFDWFALERVVGSQRAARLLSNEHKGRNSVSTFTFT